jgi:predicted N-acyltransferase
MAEPTVEVLSAVRGVARDAWNALGGGPFLDWEWLDLLEESGCVRAETGWLPQHLVLRDGDRLLGACPLYVKAHSMGEYVFDQGWAAAAQRARMAYYPKLVVAVPFTPATGPRFLAAPGAQPPVATALAAVLEDLCRTQRYSSAHVNFCTPDDAAALAARGWLRREAVQYHWQNPGYATFDDWLDALRSKRRNQVRRERRELAEQRVEIVALAGDEIPQELVPTLYRLYRGHVRQFAWGHEYLNRRAFELMWERWRHRLCAIVARKDGEVIAGTTNVQSADVFYGRYWGAFRTLRHLHFNVCYYAAIEHCIRHRLARFEPGAGGEWKHLRGFDAAVTVSMHHVAEPRLRAAVADFLERERAAVADEVAWLDERTAHKRDAAGDDED